MSSLRPPSSNDPNLGRRRAARYLLGAEQFKNTVLVSPQPKPILHNSMLAGLQVALTTIIVLPLVYFSPWPDMIGFASLGALAALYGRFAPHADRGRVVLSCGAALVFGVGIISLTAWAGMAMVLQLGLLAVLCGFFLFLNATLSFGPPGALIFIFATGAALAETLTTQQLIERIAITAFAALVAWGVTRLSDFLRHEPTVEQPMPTEPLRPLRSRLIAAARTAVGTAIAVYISYGLGANYPAWAAMGALAVLQGTHLHISMSRAVQRMVGTVLGSLLAWLILSYDPSMLVIVLFVLGMQMLTEFTMGYNYGLAQVFITPMALLMTSLARPLQDNTQMVPERILDTLIGAVVGILVAIMLSTLDDRKYLANLRKKSEM